MLDKNKGVKKTKNKYLNNKDLLKEVVESKKKGKMSDKLAIMLQMLCSRYSKRANFAGYTFNDDMQGFAMYMLVKTWASFNQDKSNNPFAFYTQCIKHSFMQYLNQEKKHRDLRDELLIDSGMLPSHTYMSEYEDIGDSFVDRDYHDHSKDHIEDEEHQ